MLSPEYLESCADPLIKLYQDLEDQIIADIARRIAKTGTLTETADWQYKVIREIGAVQQDIITRVSQMSGRTEEEIRRLFQESAFINIETNAAPLISNGYEVELDLTPPMRQLIAATLKRTAGDIGNLTLTTGVTGGNLFYEMCNQAYMQASSGAFSPQEAIWNAVKGAAQEGATVQYAKRRDKLDVAIRRNILTSLNQTAGKITEMNADQLGAEYYETSAHPGARPSHAAWQGRVFKIVGATREYPNFEESSRMTFRSLLPMTCCFMILSSPDPHANPISDRYVVAPIKAMSKFTLAIVCAAANPAILRELRFITPPVITTLACVR